MSIFIVQISSVMEENNLINETYQSSKKDLQAIIVQLEEQLKEQKSNEDALKAKLETFNSEVGQKAELQNRLKEIEEQLATAEARLKEEVIILKLVFHSIRHHLIFHLLRDSEVLY